MLSLTRVGESKFQGRWYKLPLVVWRGNPYQVIRPPVMRSRFAFLTSSLAILAGFGLPITGRAAGEEWKDTQGNSFRAEPVGSLGPLALFRTKRTGGRMLAWRALSPGDCVRFYEQIRDKPARADDWTQAKSVISREIAGKVMRVQGDKLVEAELKGRPEPFFFILFFANNAVSKSWDMLGHSIAPFNQLQQAFPGMVEGLFLGMWHSSTEHQSMAVSLKLPWLVADFYEEKSLATIAAFTPGDPEAFSMVVVNGDGVPVFSTTNPEDPELNKLFADLTGLLDLMRPGNPRSWQDRAYYLRAVQPVAHANDRSDPVLVGNPLVPEGLRKNGVLLVDATIEVAADGRVTDVVIKPGANVPQKMIGPLGDALKKACVFVAAVDHGNFVAGTFNYHLEVPH